VGDGAAIKQLTSFLSIPKLDFNIVEP